MEATIISGAWKGHLGRGLAPRELECVMSFAQGMTAKEIARMFGISPITVNKRFENARFKLGVSRRTALVAEAMKRQIIAPMCIALAGLVAVHAMTDDHDLRRDRRAPERRGAELHMTRRADALEHVARGKPTRMNTHPLFQQKIDVLAALMQRTAAARAEFQGKSRFYVEPRGDGWAVVHASTNRLHGQCKRYPEAVQYAEKLERAMDGRLRTAVGAKEIGERMTRWASGLGLVLVVWAMWGAT